MKGSTEALWKEGADGAYTRLFGQQPSAYQIWRSVQVLREIRDELTKLRSTLSGRAASIADSGALLAAHVVFQRIGSEAIEEPDSDLDAIIRSVPEQVRGVLACLIDMVDKLFTNKSYITSTFASDEKSRQLVQAVLLTLAAGNGTPDLSAFVAAANEKRAKRPPTIHLLVDHDLIPDGTLLAYAASDTEERAIGAWLDQDPRRRRATWLNDRKAPILWEADGRRYSPTGLVNYIWQQAEWREQWSAVQGPKQWRVPGEGTLVEIAERLWRRLDTEQEPEEASES